MKSQAKFRIILTDDHQLIRSGLRSLIEGRDDLQIVAEAGNGIELQAALAQKPCDMVILDLSMPEMDGLRTIAWLGKEHPGLKILVLTMHKDRDYFKKALSLGVHGYILKDEVFERLLGAIKDIRGGRKSFSSEIQSLIVEEYTVIQESHLTLELLTRREQEVLRLVAAGKMNKEIAHELSISIRTVESHRASIMEKLGFENLAALIKFAVNRGVI